jgi:hypothetical protein
MTLAGVQPNISDNCRLLALPVSTLKLAFISLLLKRY